MTTRVGAKGQVVIPKALRDQMRIQPGDEVDFAVRDREIVLSRVARPPALGGRFARSGMAARLLADRAREPRWCYRYTAIVAKVMISLPDRLLARVDAEAAERGSTRSATLRRLAEAGMGERERLLAAKMAEIDGQARGHGGDVVRELKAGRPG